MENTIFIFMLITIFVSVSANLNFFSQRKLILCIKHTIQLCLCAVACIALQDSRENCRQLMGVMANHIQVIAILVIPWVAAFDVVDFLLQPSFSVCIICLHRQHFRVIRWIGSAGNYRTNTLCHHRAGGHGIHQHTGDEEKNPCHQEALLVAHDECPCLLCLFFYRPCGFSGFGRSLGGISGSLTGALGDGILLFDTLFLLPAGERVAGKLRIFP